MFFKSFFWIKIFIVGGICSLSSYASMWGYVEISPEELNRLRALEQQVPALNKELQVIKSENTSHNNQINSLKNQLNEAKNSITEKTQQIMFLTTKSDGLINNISELSRVIQDKEKVIIKHSECAGIIQQKELDINDLKSANQKLINAIGSKKDNSHEMIAKNGDLYKELEKTRKENISYQERLKLKETRENDLLGQLSGLKNIALTTSLTKYPERPSSKSPNIDELDFEILDNVISSPPKKK